MFKTLQAELLPNGSVRFLEPLPPLSAHPQPVLVTLTRPLDEALSGERLSEPALAEDWLRAEEDAAWTHLQPAT